MSMRHMSKIVFEAPETLRTRLGRNLTAAAAVWNAEKDRVLGVRGTKDAPSRPGQVPHEVTGQLRAGTRAIPAASKLEIQIVTTAVGKILNNGGPKIARRPFINQITRQAFASMKTALHRR